MPKALPGEAFKLVMAVDALGSTRLMHDNPLIRDNRSPCRRVL